MVLSITIDELLGSVYASLFGVGERPLKSIFSDSIFKDVNRKSEEEVWRERGQTDAYSGIKRNLWDVTREGHDMMDERGWSFEQRNKWITRMQESYEKGYDDVLKKHGRVDELFHKRYVRVMK